MSPPNVGGTAPPRSDTRDRAGEVAAHLRVLGPVASLLDSQLGSVVQETEAAAMSFVDSVNLLDRASSTVVARVSDLADEAGRSSSAVADQMTSTRNIVRELARSGEDRDGTVLALLGRVAEMSGEVSQIAKALKMLSLNARIEANRSGASGASFTVVADEMRSLAVQSQERADSMARDLDLLRNEVTSVLHESSVEMDDKLGVVANELEELSATQERFSELVLRVVAEVGASAEQVAGIAGEVLAGTQFQDITRQVIEHVQQGLRDLGAEIVTSADCLETGRPLPDEAKGLAEALYARYVTAGQRQRHVALLGDAQAVSAAPVDDGPAIELF